MLLALAVLYYKKGNFERSLQYLRNLSKENKDTKNFLRDAAGGGLGRWLFQMSPYGYQPSTIEELVQCYMENQFLLTVSPPFSTGLTGA